MFNNQVLSKLSYTQDPRAGLQFSRGERLAVNKGSPVTDVTKGKDFGNLPLKLVLWFRTDKDIVGATDSVN